MIVDEMELVGRLKDAEPLRPEAFEEARVVLRAAMAVDGADAQESAPSGARRLVARNGHGGHRVRPGMGGRRALAGVAAAAVVVGGAGAYLASTSGSSSSHSQVVAGSSTATPATQTSTPGTQQAGHQPSVRQTIAPGSIILTASRIRLIKASTAAVSDSGTATEIPTNPPGATKLSRPANIMQVTFSGQNFQVQQSAAEGGGESRVVDGQLYVQVNPDNPVTGNVTAPLVWWHDTAAGAADGIVFPDPSTLVAGIGAAAGLRYVGHETVDGQELTHYHATTPAAIPPPNGLKIGGGPLTTFNIWVDSNNITQKVSLATAAQGLTVIFHHLGQPQTIAVPAGAINSTNPPSTSSTGSPT